MNRQELIAQIQKKKSFLCVGLDADVEKIPTFLNDFDNPLLEFNKRIIDATKNYAVSYKPNIAFYERLGSKGWDILKATLDYIPKDIFTIADAKRGDIGNTSSYYAKTFFEYMDFDSVTVAPYMGEDSVKPFLEFDDKWVILLGLTSNKGALDFQNRKMEDGRFLFEHVVEKAQDWGTPENLMFVVGATRSELIMKVRNAAPDSFFLVPGVGAQGGSLDEVVEFGKTKDVGLLVNSSRGIIYAGSDENFEHSVSEAAATLQKQMELFL